jgi:hypothetical protein
MSVVYLLQECCLQPKSALRPVAPVGVCCTPGTPQATLREPSDLTADALFTKRYVIIPFTILRPFQLTLGRLPISVEPILPLEISDEVTT